MRENSTPLPGKFTSLHTSAEYTQRDGGLSNANWIRSNPRSPSYSPICFLRDGFTRPSRQPGGPWHCGACGQGCPSWASASGGRRWHGQRPPHECRHGNRSRRSWRQHPCRSCIWSVSPLWKTKCLEHVVCLLAVGGLGAVVDGDLGLAGLLGVAGLLGDHVHTTVLSGLDTDSLRRGIRTCKGA